ncbi:MAG: S-layer homology domain-containing protein [Oscillospiraceae bacterium]|nr:S-layer homology domain-containing protein [Oscillospiraceae bacterium]
MKKKRLAATALALVFALLMGTCGAFAAGTDTDTQLETVRAVGIIVGDENGNMNLSSYTTRAQFVKMMTAASAYKDSVTSGTGTGSSLFTDVKSTHWATEYIKLAVEQEWVTGYVDGSFRPDNTITLEEACTALLRLLGYTSDTLTGSYPTAQLSKARSVGLLDDVTVSQGELLTRQDCVTLFYNLLTSDTSSGAVYGTTLGYTITNGEVDYSALVATDTKGPYVASANDTLTLPFSESGITVYKNGTISSVSDVEKYDVFYYNENIRTVWVYNDRGTATLTAVSPSAAAPTAVTVAGTTYSLETTTATYKVSSQGSFTTGDIVTLLLGMNGEVADIVSAEESSTTYYGVVISSEKSASSSDTSSSSASVQIVTQLACTDGVLRTFYHTGTTYSLNRLLSVTYSDSETVVKGLSEKSLSGKVNSDGTTFAGYNLASDVKIVDTDSGGGYTRVYTSRLAGSTLQSSNVRYYTLNSAGEIDQLILYEATGDTFSYVYMTAASTGSSTTNSYQYLLGGVSQSLTSSASYNVSVGGAALIYDSNGLKSIRQLTSVKLSSVGDLTATAASGISYTLDENVQVVLKQSTKFYAADISDIEGGDYTLTGWYDNFSFSAGGRIRIIVAEEK